MLALTKNAALPISSNARAWTNRCIWESFTIQPFARQTAAYGKVYVRMADHPDSH